MLKPGDAFGGIDFLIEKCSILKTKKGEDYLALDLRDAKQNVYQGKIWQYSSDIHGNIKSGDVVCLTGKVSEYSGQAQITIIDIMKSVTPPSVFSKGTKFNIEEMWNFLVEVIDSFTEPMTKFIAEELLVRQAQIAFQKAPAAKGVHNAWLGGLIEHTYGMCNIATGVLEFYQQRYEMPISKDKVLFGVLLHDIGKILEYDYSNPAFNLTPVGILTNHLVLGPAWIHEQANIYKDRYLAEGNTLDDFRLEKSLLMHLVAAHHGTKEWGSPVVPSTLEAILVHQVDMIDTNMMHALEYIKEKPSDLANFSARSWMTQSQFYKGSHHQ